MNDKAMMTQVVRSHTTGIATMTPDEWQCRAAMVRRDAEDMDRGSKLRRALYELGLDDYDNHGGVLGATFADLMGVSAATVDKWCTSGKVPHYALAYIELARVLKAAQKPLPVPEPSAAPVEPVEISRQPVVPGGSLLPAMPTPPHLR